MASKSVTLRIPDELLQAIDDCGEGNRSEAILSLVRMGLQQLGKPVSVQDNQVRQASKTANTNDVLQTVLQLRQELAELKQEIPTIVKAEVEELGK